MSERKMPAPLTDAQHKDLVEWARQAGASPEVLRVLDETGRDLAGDGAREAALRAMVPDLSHVGAELHAKWDAEDSAGYPIGTEATYESGYKNGVQAERRRLAGSLGEILNSPAFKEADGWLRRADDAGRFAREVLRALRELVATIEAAP